MISLSIDIDRVSMNTDANRKKVSKQAPTVQHKNTVGIIIKRHILKRYKLIKSKKFCDHNPNGIRTTLYILLRTREFIAHTHKYLWKAR